MSANTFTLEAAAAANIQVVGSDKGSQAVHDLIVAYQANRRTGSANSKTRAEVSGNNKRYSARRAPVMPVTAISALPSLWAAAWSSVPAPATTARR